MKASSIHFLFNTNLLFVFLILAFDIMRLQLYISQLGFLAFLFRPAWQLTCYFPNGDIAPNDTPCTNETTSACCNEIDYCYDNGLCNSEFRLTRGSCTDKSWGGLGNAPECASQCKNGQSCKIFVPVEHLTNETNDQVHTKLTVSILTLKQSIAPAGLSCFPAMRG